MPPPPVDGRVTTMLPAGQIQLPSFSSLFGPTSTGMAPRSAILMGSAADEAIIISSDEEMNYDETDDEEIRIISYRTTPFARPLLPNHVTTAQRQAYTHPNISSATSTDEQQDYSTPPSAQIQPQDTTSTAGPAPNSRPGIRPINKKLFPCPAPNCNQTFRRIGERVKHIKLRHANLDTNSLILEAARTKSFTCAADGCEARFEDRKKCDAHMMTAHADQDFVSLKERSYSLMFEQKKR